MTTKPNYVEPWGWEWTEGEDDEAGNEWVTIFDAEAEEVATLMVRDAAKWKTEVGPDRERDAARIVACVNACAGMNPEAVPDLLAALKMALPWLEDADRPGNQQITVLWAALSATRAALAKAERDA